MAEAHILVVDDDPAMRGLLADYLIGQRLRVSAVANSRDMARILGEEPVDLVVLDLKLGDEDGLQLLKELRSRLPIIIISGHWRDEVDRIVGLELGADDYLTKPFSLRELLARVRAILRRVETSAAAPQVDGGETGYRFVGWDLDLRTQRLTSPKAARVVLTAGEFSLLVAFLRAPQRVLSRERLINDSRLHGQGAFDRSIDVQILRLRRKLEADSSTPALIKTVRGLGYIFTVPVQPL